MLDRSNDSYFSGVVWLCFVVLEGGGDKIIFGELDVAGTDCLIEENWTDAISIV